MIHDICYAGLEFNFSFQKIPFNKVSHLFQDKCSQYFDVHLFKQSVSPKCLYGESKIHRLELCRQNLERRGYSLLNLTYIAG